MVNFDQLKDRVAITIDEDQRERFEKARIRKSSPTDSDGRLVTAFVVCTMLKRL
jgi:hypothetical protein